MPTTVTSVYPPKDSAAALMSIGAAVVKMMATALAATGCVHTAHFDTIVHALWRRLSALKLAQVQHMRHRLPSDTGTSAPTTHTPGATHGASTDGSGGGSAALGDAEHAAVARALVSPLDALHVCCIALRLCRAVVLYPDIVVLATTGRLPVFTMLHDLEKPLLR